MTLILVAALSLLAVRAPDAPTLEQTLAEIIAEALPETQYPWQLEWRAFGVYGGREIDWHLASPDETRDRDPPPPGVTRRTGSTSHNGSVSVCGNSDRVGAVMLGAPWRGDGDLTPELAQAGVVATLVEQRDRTPVLDARGEPHWDTHQAALARSRPAFQRFRLERLGFEPAFLTANFSCTPPGTRYATYCRMDWTLELRAGPEPRAEPCIPPAHPWPPQSQS